MMQYKCNKNYEDDIFSMETAYVGPKDIASEAYGLAFGRERHQVQLKEQ
jgi:hypothetical protein